MNSHALPRLAAGRFALARKVGDGGMATVFLAWDRKLKVWRAAKVLLPQFVRKVKVRRRFENEAHAMARLEHPHIIRVYDVGVENDFPYLVMEYAHGGCVVEWLESNGPMPGRLASDILLQVSSGIHAAHQASIVHRDIKPHNILVNHQGVCKVTDFGIAQLMENDSLTKTGSVMGTWGYMAPEQRSDAKMVDGRADVFGLGATLYAVLTARTPTELYVAAEDDEMFAGVPKPLLPVIRKACSYRAEDRYEDVLAFARALKAAAADLAIDPEHTPSLVQPAAPLPRGIEDWTVEPGQLKLMQEALGLNYDPDNDPTVHARRGTLASFNASLSGASFEGPSSSSDVSPDELASMFQGAEIGYEVDPASAATVEPAPVASPVIADELPPHASVIPEDALEAPEPEPEPEPESDWMDMGLRLSAIPLVLGIASIVVLGWGMVVVNAAHQDALKASQPLVRAMDEGSQGPIIDGLVIAGAERAELESLFAAYQKGGKSALPAARAYTKVVRSQAHIHREEASAKSIREGVEELGRADAQYALAEGRWRQVSDDFPGWVAVSLGMADRP